MPNDAPRVRLGELLVNAGVLTAERLEAALKAQAAEGNKRRLGRLLVEQGFVDETLLTQVLGRQLSVPWVSLYHVDFSRQLLNLVPREVAEGYGLIPVYVRHVRGQGETLYVATDDPTNEDGLKRVSAYAGLPVRAMIASASDIRAAIRVYYGAPAPPPPPPAPEPPAPDLPAPEPLVGATLPSAAVPVVVTLTAAPPVEAAPRAPVAVEVVPSGPPLGPAPGPSKRPSGDEDYPVIEAHSIEIPRRKSKTIALTFLDGTTINLPAPKKKRPAPEPTPEPELATETQLTARDLVAALRAVSQGADAGDILGDNPRWEAHFAALLSVLMRKHLIADWEFVEELKKMQTGL